MTEGVFEVAEIHHAAIPEKELLRLTALAESFSNHPISRSLQEAAGNPGDASLVTSAQEKEPDLASTALFQISSL